MRTIAYPNTEVLNTMGAEQWITGMEDNTLFTLWQDINQNNANLPALRMETNHRGTTTVVSNGPMAAKWLLMPFIITIDNKLIMFWWSLCRFL